GGGQVEVPIAGAACPAARVGRFQIDLEAKLFQRLLGVFVQAFPGRPVGEGQHAYRVIGGVHARFLDQRLGFLQVELDGGCVGVVEHLGGYKRAGGQLAQAKEDV